MANKMDNCVEFVGGPYDGHQQPFDFSQELLADVVLLPVNRNMLKMVHGKRGGPRAAPSSVAVYELTQRDGIKRYQYWWSASPEHLQLQDWLA